MRYKITRRVLMFWTLFISIGAIAGSLAMFYDPTGHFMGMDTLLPYFQVLPLSELLYQNYLFPACALLIINGLTNLMAFLLLLKNNKLGIILGGLFGVTLMLWICIQFYIFPLNFMSTSYFIFGFLQFITGYMTYVFYKQEHFTIDYSKYTHINTNPQELVIYFSRMGYVKKIAYEYADQTGAYLYEIQALELVEGTLGFWWCGRFGMHQWDMPIKEIDIDLSQYQQVTICTPIWVFDMAAPIRTFCKQAQLKSVNYILVHHQKNDYRKVADKMDALLHIKHQHFISIQCQKGSYKLIRKE